MATTASPPPAVRMSSERGQRERVLPHSEEAERGVLGAMLLDADRVIDLCLAKRMNREFLHVQAHQVLFEQMVSMHQELQQVDILTLSQRLRDRDLLEKIGGPSMLEQLVDATPTVAHAEFYINIVYQKYVMRALVRRATETIDSCFDPDNDAETVLGDAEQAFFEITDLQEGGAEEWSALVKQSMSKIEQVFQTKRGLTGLPTGFQDIDQKLLGLKDGEMIILAARPSMGKTSLAMNIVEHVATGCTGQLDSSDQGPRSVGIFSLEMSAEQLVDRMICSRAKVSSHRLASGNMPLNCHQNLMHSADDLMKATIVLDDTPGLSVLELRSRARRMKRRHAVDLIVIDYLQLLNFPQFAREGRQRETAAISGALKTMAKELRVPVIVLSQLSRAPETRDRLAVPKLSDLRDSGSIEQDADVVLLLRRPSRYPDDPEAEDTTLAVIEVAKHRNGPLGSVPLFFREAVVRFESLESPTHSMEFA